MKSCCICYWELNYFRPWWFKIQHAGTIFWDSCLSVSGDAKWFTLLEITMCVVNKNERECKFYFKENFSYHCIKSHLQDTYSPLFQRWMNTPLSLGKMVRRCQTGAKASWRPSICRICRYAYQGVQYISPAVMLELLIFSSECIVEPSPLFHLLSRQN